MGRNRPPKDLLPKASLSSPQRSKVCRLLATSLNNPPTVQQAIAAPYLHRLIGLAFRAFVLTVRVLPDWLAYAFADGLAVLLVIYTHATRRRSTRRRMGFHHNVRIAFRDQLTGRPRCSLLWRWARHMTHMGIDTCKMPQITSRNVHDYCDLTEIAQLREQYDRGKGVLAVSGHVGVYEFTPHLMTLSGMAVVTIFRPSPIRPVTDVINEIRSAGGQEMTERKGGVRQVLRALRNKKIAGLLVDVSSKRSDIYAPFLGTPAATNSTAGMLHVKTGAPIVVATTQRTARRRYKLHVWDVVEGSGADPRDVEVHATAARINDALSRAIRSYPEQWFWDSRRFRARPEGEMPDGSGLPPQTNPDQAFTIAGSKE
ncbi:MAG: lysophospholipid acyltransferase family protein [Planctomycetota bacterium]|nr:lysophospholipid acyltransferase family protein [Planctomycetota bacterium]